MDKIWGKKKYSGKMWRFLFLPQTKYVTLVKSHSFFGTQFPQASNEE